MGEVNTCLKRIYTVVISVIAALALLLLGFVLYGFDLSNATTIVHFLWYGFCAVILLLVILGGVGAWSKKKWALIVFAVGMILICLCLFGATIVIKVYISQIEDRPMEYYINKWAFIDIHNKKTGFLHFKQQEQHCCGLQSYRDWGNDIPDTCLCVAQSTNPCVAAPRDSNLFKEGQTVMIYAKPCLPIILSSEVQGPYAVLGRVVGFLLLLALSVGLCVAILCQINKKPEIPEVVYSVEEGAGNNISLMDASKSSEI